MLLQLPRLTNSLRNPFDVDQAYLHRKTILQNLKPSSSANSVQESQLAWKIVYRWDDASSEVRQVYKQFIGAMVELMGGEVVSEEFQEVALSVYKLFVGRLEDDQVDKIISEKKLDLQKLFGHEIPHSKLQRVVSLVKRLSELQKKDDGTVYIPEGQDESADDMEFGADLVFRAPARFLVDVALEDSDLFVEEAAEIPNHGAWYDHGDSAMYNPSVSGGNFDLEWLRDACDKIVCESISLLPRDELAMAICRVLDSEKPGDEIAGDLLDLVGDSAFEIVQDLIMHRKELLDAIHHGLFVLKSDKNASNLQSRMPSYGTQVTVQTESERQLDKLRRKEEKKHRRGTDHGVENDIIK